MSKTAVIHQPDFLPWLGFFDRLLSADVLVVLDNVQFVSKSSRSWVNRDKIKTTNGEKWITVGTVKCHLGTNINEVLLSNTNWRESMRNHISENYRRSKYYNEIFPCIEELLDYKCDKLVDFNMKSIKILLSLFDIDIDLVYASSLKAKGRSNELLVNILTELGASTYISGIGARAYLEEKLFLDKKIKVIWQNFEHPIYLQEYGDFIPYLSSIDLLFNCGINESRRILRGE